MKLAGKVEPAACGSGFFHFGCGSEGPQPGEDNPTDRCEPAEKQPLLRRLGAVGVFFTLSG